MSDFPQLYNYSDHKSNTGKKVIGKIDTNTASKGKGKGKKKTSLVKSIRASFRFAPKAPDKTYSLKSYGGSHVTDEAKAGEPKVKPGSYDPEMDDSLNSFSLVKPSQSKKDKKKSNECIKKAAIVIFVLFVISTALFFAFFPIRNGHIVLHTSDLDDQQQQNSSMGIDLPSLFQELLPASTKSKVDLHLDSPQAKAFKWVEENEETLKGIYSSNEELLQVFVLVTFYFSMNGDSWLSTAHNDNKWLSSETHICQWHPDSSPNMKHLCYQDGETVCNSFEEHKKCQLTQLSITENQLEGSIPREIGLLTTLQRIELTSNNIHGTIPTEIQSLKELLTLGIDNNMLSNQIPTEIGQLSNLMKLNIAKNRLTGTIPTEIGNLKHLLQINLHTNSLQGYIITEIGRLTKLVELHLGENSLKSFIPTEIGRLSNTFKYIDISNNDISGTIPKVFGSLKHLDEMIAESCSFTGTIPTEIIHLPNLKALRLKGNSLSGNFTSTSNHVYKSLEYLDLANNQLSGTISEEINRILPNIKFLLLDNNNLGGTLPSSISLLSSSLEVFSVTNNELHGTIPTDFGSLTSLLKLQLTNNQFTGDISLEICQLKESTHLEVILNCLEVDCICDCTCA